MLSTLSEPREIKGVQLKTFQDDFIFSPARFPAFIGGWAVGKSLCGIARGMTYSKHIPDNLGVIFRKEFTDLRDSTLQDFERYTKLKVDSGRNVKLENGSTIMFRHLEEINNIQNINLGWFLIEQVDELETDKEFFMLHGRLRRQVQPDPFFKELGLPERTGFVIGNVGQAWVKNLWKISPQEDYSLVEATTFDNADVLPEDYLKSLRALETQKPEIYRRYVINDWTMEDEAFILIPQRYLEAIKKVMFYETIIGDVIACDPSLGGDECVIYVMRNSRIIDRKYMYERDTMKIVGELMLLSAKHEIDNLAVDTIGIGQGIGDRLCELGKNVIPIISSQESSNKQLFYNRRTEMWWYVMQRIMDKELPYPTDDPELIRQLTSVKYKVLNSNGLVQLEPKAETKKRLDRSPDRADAFVYAVWSTQFCNPRNERIKPYSYRQLVRV